MKLLPGGDRRGAEQQAGRASGNALAALTMVRDEAEMLPRWLDHYGAQCGVENLFVLDDNSSDGSTDDLPCSVLRLPDLAGRHFEKTRMTLVSGIAAGLLAAYDAVLFADADEFLVADPAKYAGLTDLLAARPERRALGAMNLNVVHDVASEPPLDPRAPVLGQRRLAKFVPLMCKPAVKRTSAPWVAASHGLEEPFEIDPDLYLFHLKFADRDLLRAAGDRRKVLADAEGRAAATSWQFHGDELVDLLAEITAEGAASRAKPFTPPRRKLGRIVQQMDNGSFRATGARQVPAMRKQPLVAVPERFFGLV